MKYTVIFLFNQDLKKVLLIHKNRGPYPDSINGVGGKVDASDASEFDGAVREIKEETDVNVGNRLHWLTTCTYPSGTRLYVCHAQIDENEVKQVEDEKLEWYDIESLFKNQIDNPIFAGEGSVLYFVNAALIDLKNKRNNIISENCCK